MIIVGHRGAKGLAPENTVKSILKALEYNVDEIEVDARVTQDNVAVLTHGKSISTNDGQKFRVSSYTFEELLKFKSDLTTLDEAIRIASGKARLRIEINNIDRIDPIIGLLKSKLDTGCKSSDFLLASFKFKILLMLKKEFPDIELVVNENWSGVMAGFKARKLSTHHISTNQRWLWSGYLKLASKNGTQIDAFTINSPSRAKKLQSYGLQCVITDFPDRFNR